MGRSFFAGARPAGPVTAVVPPHAAGKPPHWPARPAEIEMVRRGRARGFVTRRVLLGDIIDYVVEGRPDRGPGAAETCAKPLFGEGDRCGSCSPLCNWYDDPERGERLTRSDGHDMTEVPLDRRDRLT